MTTDPSSAGLLSPQPDLSPANSWRPLSNCQQDERKAPVPATSYGTAATPHPDERIPILTIASSSPDRFPISPLDLLLRVRLFIYIVFFSLILIVITSLGAGGRNLHQPFIWGILLFLASHGTCGSCRQLRLYRKQELTWKRMSWTSLLRAAIWMPVLVYHAYFASVTAIMWFAKGEVGLLAAFAAGMALVVGWLVIAEVAVGGVALAKVRQEKRAAQAEF